MLSSWTYDGYGINLIKNSDLGDLSNYIANGEWNLEELSVYRNVKTYSCCPNPYPNITYHVIIKRRPLFYVFNMILPSMLITIVGFLGFLIPPDSGEKVSMGVTTLLSMTVFLMLVAESMPPNSDSVPLIASYYFGSMFIISLATAGTVLSLNIHKKGNEGKPVSRIIQKLFFGVIAKILLINIDLRITKYKSRIVPSRFKQRSSLQEHSAKNQDFFDVEGLILTETKPRGNINKIEKSYCGNFDEDVLSNRLLIRESPLISKNNWRKTKSQKEYKSAEEDFSSISSDHNRETLNGINLVLKAKDYEDHSHSFRELYYNQKKLMKMLKDFDRKIDFYELREQINEYREEVRIQWTQLAYVIDALLGYTF
ncbi:neuronal acetylcholine receptor subunit alpha-10-like, partial [Brachionus plicatilis]